MAHLHSYSISQLIQLLTGDTLSDSSCYLGQFKAGHQLLTYPYRVQSFSIGLVYSGWLTFTHNLNEYTISQGQLMIIRPGEIHSIIACSDDLVMTAFFFNLDFLKDVKQWSGLIQNLSYFQQEAVPFTQLNQSEQKRMDAYFQLMSALYEKLPAFSQSLQLQLLTILTDIQQIYIQNQLPVSTRFLPDRSAELVNLYFQKVSQHYLTIRHVQDYANQLSISSKHLSETVKKLSGKPAGYWIDQMLLQEAQVLLRQTSSSIAEIATYLRFSDQSAFGKFFRKNIGVSPTKFRENT